MFKNWIRGFYSGYWRVALFEFSVKVGEIDIRVV